MFGVNKQKTNKKNFYSAWMQYIDQKWKQRVTNDVTKYFYFK